MNSYAYYNGRFGKKEDISIPLSDRSIFFGDAIYDAAIGVYDRILWEEDHIDRFLANASRLDFKHNLNKKYLSSLLREIAVKSMIECYFIYFQLSRNSITRCHCAKGCGTNLLITIDPIEIKPNNPPLKLITVNDDRYNFCDIKTVNLLPAVISMTNANESNCDEAVFIKDGIVTECSKSNIFILNQGRIATHPKSNRILPGIARDHLLKICKQNGLEFEERKFTYDELIYADEILVTSTTKLCQPAGEINNISVGGKSPALANQLCSQMYQEFADFCII